MIDDEGYTVVDEGVTVANANPIVVNNILHRYLVYGDIHTEMVYATSEQHARDLSRDFVGNVFFVQHLDLPC